jgi:hypothetical protein
MIEGRGSGEQVVEEEALRVTGQPLKESERVIQWWRKTAS